MKKYPLEIHANHFYLPIGDRRYLLDTGAPMSFANHRDFVLLEQSIQLDTGYMGLTAEKLSEYVGHPTDGLLGTDVLNRFDLLFDVPGGCLTVSSDELDCAGTALELEEFMGIPIVTAHVGDEPVKLFFDTGAQISYLQNIELSNYPDRGHVTDFFPGMGQFQTACHKVPLRIGPETHELRCGSLPGLLGMTLMLADVDGILGNELLLNRVIGYFPRRNLLAVGEAK